LRNQAKGKEYVKKTVLIYSSQGGERDSVLKNSAFRTDVSVLLPENLGSKELATEGNESTRRGKLPAQALEQ
jgi:hypothetical protein